MGYGSKSVTGSRLGSEYGWIAIPTPARLGVRRRRPARQRSRYALALRMRESLSPRKSALRSHRAKCLLCDQVRAFRSI